MELIEYLTVKEVATRLRVHVRIIQRLIRDGELPAVRVGKEYRIHVSDFAKFINEGKGKK